MTLVNLSKEELCLISIALNAYQMELDKVKNFDLKELKLMYDLLMEDVYGDNGVKGY